MPLQNPFSHSMLNVLILFFLLVVANTSAESESQEATTTTDSEEAESDDTLRKILPSEKALEEISVQLLDALIKRGQMEMAKGAFRTQLEVLRKVQPEQYKKFKKISIDQLAAEAVIEQADLAKMMPKTGNRLVDMLHENGIPIGSSIKGIQQAIKTQREIENSDPAEQILKAILEKFQKQILPGIVANAIAGRNPFQMPSRQQIQQMANEGKQSARKAEVSTVPFYAPTNIKRKPIRNPSNMIAKETSRTMSAVNNDDEDGRSLESSFEGTKEATHFGSNSGNSADIPSNLLSRIRSSPHLLSLYQKIVRTKLKDTGRENAEQNSDSQELPSAEETGKKQPRLGLKEALMIGAFAGETEDQQDDDEDVEPPRKAPTSSRNYPVHPPDSKSQGLIDLSELSRNLERPEKYLEPRRVFNNPNPQPGIIIPRKLPKRPRTKLPLLIGVDPDLINDDPAKDNNPDNPFVTRRRAPPSFTSPSAESRVLERLRNNPALAALFEQTDLAERLGKNQVLSDSQKGYTANRGHSITTYPNHVGGVKTFSDNTLSREAEVKQVIEERPIPPLLFTPKGKHTRVRFVGATEREIPGLGGRLIIPSLDPTKPAINTVMRTQGKHRDEYDTIFKIPNSLDDGGSIGMHSKTRSELFYGGDGTVDTPALGIQS